MRFPDIIFSGVERHGEAIAEARAAGRLGATRIPDAALATELDPSDTFIGRLLDAHAAGLAERQKDAQS